MVVIGEVFNTINHGGIFTYLYPIIIAFGVVVILKFIWENPAPEEYP